VKVEVAYWKVVHLVKIMEMGKLGKFLGKVKCKWETKQRKEHKREEEEEESAELL
jgi:hypothetical protein